MDLPNRGGGDPPSDRRYQRRRAERQLLLLFDDFEELEMRVKSGKLEPTIFPFFHHLMQYGGKLDFIFVGTHRLEALSSDYRSIFSNIVGQTHFELQKVMFYVNMTLSNYSSKIHQGSIYV